MINVFKLLSGLLVILLGENTKSVGRLPGILTVSHFLEPRAGFEPAAYSLQGCCSSQLSYRGECFKTNIEIKA